MSKLFPTHPFPAPPTPPSVVFKQPPKTPLFPTNPFTGSKPPAVIKQEKIDKAKKDAKAKADAAAKAAAAGSGGAAAAAGGAGAGAAAGWGKLGPPSTYKNSDFDPRIASANPWFPPLTSRGSIVQNREWLKASGLKDQKYPFKLQFLYNPSELSYSYGYTADRAVPAELTAFQSATPIVGGEGLTTLSIELLFDRTYDVLDGKIPSGCLDDVTAFQAIVGIVGGQGNLMLTPLDVYFGAAVDVTKFIVDAHNYPRPISTLHFHGYVTGASVTYTHFTHDMTPVRAVISMSMTELITDAEVWKNAHPGDAAANVTPTAAPTASPNSPTKPGTPAPAGPHDPHAVAVRTAQLAAINKRIAELDKLIGDPKNLPIIDALKAERKTLDPKKALLESQLAAAKQTQAQADAKTKSDAAAAKKKADAKRAAYDKRAAEARRRGNRILPFKP